MNYQIISGYQNDKNLRNSFNELSKKVFGLDFENWYQNGFWKSHYIPYSILFDNKIVSNVSVSICDFIYEQKEVHLIQLGTIMTDPDYRGNGFSKILMEYVLKKYEDKVDGIYLFANDSVLDFYPKFGFVSKKEYQYSKEVNILGEQTIKHIPMDNMSDWAKMVEVIKTKSQNAKFYMSNNIDLYMFYLSQFMTENVYYLKEEDTYVVAEVEGDNLTLHAVFGNSSLDTVIQSFGKDIKNVTLCFTPNDKSGYQCRELHEEDTTLFVKGAFFKNVSDKLALPALSHA